MYTRTATTTLTAWIFAGFVSAATADGVPPRFAIAELGALQGGSTRGYAINEYGQTTGESGQGLISVGYHAFFGEVSGAITNIETVDGYDLSEGQAINNMGQIAGTLTYFPGTSGVSTLFRYTPDEGMTVIGTLGGEYGWVEAMNDAGSFVGEWEATDGFLHGFIYTDEDGLQELGTLGGAYSRASDINNAGQVVGYAYTADWRPRAVLWENGVMHDLGTLGGDSSEAFAINEAGVVVGSSKDADGVTRAFRYTSENGMEALPMPDGATSCTATLVTEGGMVAGVYSWNSQQHGFCFSDEEGMVDFGLNLGGTAWTGPVDASDAAGVLVWRMDTQTYEVYAMLYRAGTGLMDFNNLLAEPLDWTIDTPVATNSAGQILVSGYLTNHYMSAVLTPITPGDLDADGDVDLSDLATLLANYGASGAAYDQGDVDADGDVDIADLAYVLSVYGM